MNGASARICFVAPTAYDMVHGRVAGRFGGAQVQQVLIARELARRGHQVSFIVHDDGLAGVDDRDGIRIIRMCGQSAGLPGVRFLHPRWTSLRRALARAGAEVYYQRGAGAETGQLALWCRRHGRRFIFAAASDMDCDRAFPHLTTARERWLYRYGLRHADLVLTQTRAQARAFLSHFAIESAIVPNCGRDLIGADEAGPPDPPMDALSVLWAGRFHPWKRPEWLLDLAEAMPRIKFHVIGAAGGNGADPRLLSRAAALPNVYMHGPVAHHEIERFYRQAGLLLCTSPVEGFPNTFLEAWALGRPVVTTVDPDDVVAVHRLGRVADSVSGLAGAVHHLLESLRIWREYSRRARRFFLAHHTVEATVDRLEGLFSIPGRHPSRPPAGSLLKECNG